MVRYKWHDNVEIYYVSDDDNLDNIPTQMHNYH